MKVLILTSEGYESWLWNQIKDKFDKNDIHCYYADEPYPFHVLRGNYDIGISFMYQYKVPAEEVNSHTWFNFHPAPLPEYKGRNLCYWAIMNGETEFGATLHYMDENFDTGDIIEVLKFAIPPWATSEDLSGFAISASKQLFQLYFPRIIAGEEFKRTPNVGGTYFKKNNIPDEISFSDKRAEWFFKNEVRAITYGDFCPKIDIGGVTYKVVRE